MAKSKKPTVIKKTVKREGPSSGNLAATILGGIAGRFLEGYLGVNTSSAAGQGVKKSTIKRVH